MTNYEWITRIESEQRDEELMNYIRILSARTIKSHLDLSCVLIAIQQTWLHRPFKMTQHQVANTMEIDVILRKAARELQIPSWNGNHANSNLGILYGGGGIYTSNRINVIEATEQYIAHLKSHAPDSLLEGEGIPLRNPACIISDLPEDIVNGLLPEITGCFKPWIWDLLNALIESRLEGKR